MLTASIASHAQVSLRVADAAWTSRVVELDPSDRLHDGPTAGRPIFFWTLIAGTQAALDRMREQGRLPIWHRWTTWVGDVVPAEETVEARDRIKLGVGILEVTGKLQLEVVERDGSFDWRTWSMKEHLAAGYWQVEVVDALGVPIPCVQSLSPPGGEGCKFLIRLTE
jgi:hypothetical protein